MCGIQNPTRFCIEPYFDYTDIRNTMKLIENEERPSMQQVHINTKKFILSLFDASRK